MCIIGKFKAGGEPTKSNVIRMDHQVFTPRMDPPPTGANRDVLGDVYEELELDLEAVAATATSSKTRRSVSHKWSEVDRDRATGGTGTNAYDYDPDTRALLAEEELILSPNVDIVREKVLNPPAWTEAGSGSGSGSGSATTLLRKSIEKSLGIEYTGTGAVQGETLQIAPDYDAGKSVSDLASLKWSSAADVHPPPAVSELLQKMKSDKKKNKSGTGTGTGTGAHTNEDMELLEMLIPEGLVLEESSHGKVKPKGVV